MGLSALISIIERNVLVLYISANLTRIHLSFYCPSTHVLSCTGFHEGENNDSSVSMTLLVTLSDLSDFNVTPKVLAFKVRETSGWMHWFTNETNKKQGDKEDNLSI